MNKRTLINARSAAAAWLLAPLLAAAQVPVDDDGNPIGDYDNVARDSYSTEPAVGNEGIPLLPPAELEDLVGPIALYPDDLLAIVLPASTYPLQVVQAARFLDDLETDPELKPDPDWDDSIIALVNYPEVVELLNEDLDWTWQLGEAVVAQQADVVNAVERFRDRAYAAGNLKSDGYQTVTRDEGIIEITPVNRDVIYVPYYEPARVVHYQPRPVYYYYPRPCPVYYYPYPASYAFDRGYFWGVTTAFAIGWHTDHLSVFHHSYRGHPYYGHRYWDRWWYRRPSLRTYNTIYIDNSVNVSINRYSSGDRWRPRHERRLRYSDQRITRSVHYPGERRSASNSTTVTRDTNRHTQRERVESQRDRAVVNRDRIVSERDRRVSNRDRIGADRDRPVSADRSATTRRSTETPRIDRRREVTRGTPPAAARERSSGDRERRVQPAERPVQQQRRTTERSERRSQPSTQPAERHERRVAPVERQVQRRTTERTERRAQPSPQRAERHERRAAPVERQVQRRTETAPQQSSRQSERRAPPERRQAERSESRSQASNRGARADDRRTRRR